MARFVKAKGDNFVKQQAEAGVSIPSGTTAERSNVPVAGELRFNTDNSTLEIYDGAGFISMSKQGTVTITQDSFTGNGVDTDFTMSQSVTSNQTQRIIVAVGNVYQNPASAYTLSGTTITFTSPPPNLEPITIIHGIDSTVAA